MTLSRVLRSHVLSSHHIARSLVAFRVGRGRGAARPPTGRRRTTRRVPSAPRGSGRALDSPLRTGEAVVARPESRRSPRRLSNVLIGRRRLICCCRPAHRRSRGGCGRVRPAPGSAPSGSPLSSSTGPGSMPSSPSPGPPRWRVREPPPPVHSAWPSGFLAARDVLVVRRPPARGHLRDQPVRSDPALAHRPSHGAGEHPIALNPGNVGFSFDVLSKAGTLGITAVADPGA